MNTELGTWKPHRPRGPIAGMYNSPGPKYALPGNTGYDGHDPTRKRSPAYTFGAQSTRERSCETPGPGPAAYHLGAVAKNAPTAMLVGRCTRLEQKTSGPGPGSYRPEKVVLCSPQAPQFSFGIRHSEFMAPLFFHAAK
ncbi:ciliary microtubule associated protein 1A-like [Pseudophryne corroboree]|uniref:ciliary microtubule associated protein 1A-like n=1 Tax=Pseudophryne corroboree TaxID=495146 RepID=UPI003081817B